MSKLEIVKSIARKQGIKDEIKVSTNKDKKFMIIVNNKKIHFGQKGYQDFIDHKDEARRRNFHNRFKNNKGYNTKTSGLYYSRLLLW